METHILLPTHNRVELLKRCLNSLVPLAGELEGTTLHVIENGSRVAEALTAGYTDRLPIQYHYVEEGNKSVALNTVIEQLPVNALHIFFDDDVAVRPGTVMAFREVARKMGRGHYFGGVLYPAYEVEPAPGMEPYLSPSAKKVDMSAGQDLRGFKEFRDFLGAVWACFGEDLNTAGGFDGRYGPGGYTGSRGQETDAQLRLFQQGCRPVFVRAAGVDHHVTAEMVTTSYTVDRIFRSTIHKGRHDPSLVHSLGLAAKMIYSVLLLPLQPGSVGHLYRIAKAAGYFRGLSLGAAKDDH